MVIYLVRVNDETVAVEKTSVDALDSALGAYLEQIGALDCNLYSFRNVVKQLASGEKIEGVQISSMEV